MHVVSVVVWIGGLILLNAVLMPIAEYENQARSALVAATQRRFQAFIWSSLWVLLTTGFILMLLSPRFLWFDYSSTWSQLLAVKQVAFLLLAFFGWQMAKVLGRMEEASKENDETFQGWWLAYRALLRRSVAMGIVGLLCSAGMMVA